MLTHLELWFLSQGWPAVVVAAATLHLCPIASGMGTAGRALLGLTCVSSQGAILTTMLATRNFSGENHLAESSHANNPTTTQGSWSLAHGVSACRSVSSAGASICCAARSSVWLRLLWPCCSESSGRLFCFFFRGRGSGLPL